MDTIRGSGNNSRAKPSRDGGRLTDDDLGRIEGSRDVLAGVIQERYGKGREETEREVDNWNLRV